VVGPNVQNTNRRIDERRGGVEEKKKMKVVAGMNTTGVGSFGQKQMLGKREMGGGQKKKGGQTESSKNSAHTG